MADQKNEDITPALARRGARPFAGPTGAPAGARPFTRPATTQRPTAAPFAPPVVPGKRTLGSSPVPEARPEAPPAAPIEAQPVPSGTIEAATPQPRPVTSEMVALDAIDAFEDVWRAAEPSSGTIEPAVLASPSDVSSLGSGIDGQQVWAGEITAATEIAAAEPIAPGTPDTTGSTEITPAGTMPPWLQDDEAPNATSAAASAEDEPDPDSAAGVATTMPSSPAAAWPATAIEMGAVVGEWTDSHTIPSSDEIMGVPPEPPAAVPVPQSLGDATQVVTSWVADENHGEGDSQPHFELVEEPSAERSEPVPMTAPTADPHEPPHARIAAALDRLAERVQSGEIDVSFIAPDATDAAILAAMVAALLGGSRSR